MKEFIETLRFKNEALFFFGLVCLIAAIIFLVLTRLTSTQVMGINAWYKPFKFALSTFFFSWTMGCFCQYLDQPLNVSIYSWAVIILLGFEIVYIAWKAGQGQLSHYNESDTFHSTMFSLMAFAATAVTLWTAYMGVLFFGKDVSPLPEYYLWGIRLGILLFVIFSFEGFAMGARMSHSVGGPDGSPGLPIVNWSKKFGDLRISHFLGMHALQVIPLLSYFVIKNVKGIVLFSSLYFLLTLFLFIMALQGKPLIR
ncbi:MAG: hypothetical protein AAFN93_26645 [Bacteroidota bacterium]